MACRKGLLRLLMCIIWLAGGFKHVLFSPRSLGKIPILTAYFLDALRILTPPMETPDPPNGTPGVSKPPVLTPHDIPRILRVGWNHQLGIISPPDSIRGGRTGITCIAHASLCGDIGKRLGHDGETVMEQLRSNRKHEFWAPKMVV